MKKFLKVLSLSVVALLLILVVCIVANPLRWPEGLIKARLIKNAPLGTEMKEVMVYIKNSGWKIHSVDEENGFLDQREFSDPKSFSCSEGNGKLKHRSGYYSCVDNDSEFINSNDQKSCQAVGGKWFLSQGYDDCIVGSKNIRSELGEYGVILTTSVTVFWGFDDQGKLIDVWVWKTVDAL